MNSYSICSSDPLFNGRNDLQFGKGFFETVKIVNKKPVFLERHLNRLKNSIEWLSHGTLPPFKKIEKAMNNFIGNNNIEAGAIKLIAADSEIHMIYRPFTAVTSPVSIMISNIAKRHSSNPVYIHKTLSYLENIILWEEAEKNRVYDSLVLNECNNICEGSRHNVFIIKNNKLITPPVSSGCLPGISRQLILETIGAEEIPVTESDIVKCEECFLTNALQGIIPVKNIINRKSNTLKSEQTLLIKYRLSQIEADYINGNNGINRRNC